MAVEIRALANGSGSILRSKRSCRREPGAGIRQRIVACAACGGSKRTHVLRICFEREYPERGRYKYNWMQLQDPSSMRCSPRANGHRSGQAGCSVCRRAEIVMESALRFPVHNQVQTMAYRAGKKGYHFAAQAGWRCSTTSRRPDQIGVAARMASMSASAQGCAVQAVGLIGRRVDRGFDRTQHGEHRVVGPPLPCPAVVAIELHGARSGVMRRDLCGAHGVDFSTSSRAQAASAAGGQGKFERDDDVVSLRRRRTAKSRSAPKRAPAFTRGGAKPPGMAARTKSIACRRWCR